MKEDHVEFFLKFFLELLRFLRFARLVELPDGSAHLAIGASPGRLGALVLRIGVGTESRPFCT